MKLDALIDAVEGSDFEAKAAQGGLPNDFWETYSAFANTGGGTVILGIKEEPGGFVVAGVPNLARVKKSLFDCLNDRHKVSANVLATNSVGEVEVGGKRLLRIYVPEANRKQKPVYVSGDIMRGTFRRLEGSDYRCNEEDVRRMMAESLGDRDQRMLVGFGFADLDIESIASYRNLFRGANPDHPWLALDDLAFLTQLAAWRKDREGGAEGPTLAGLLMFGRHTALLDVLPGYQVDYRESDDEDPDVRWTYRHTVDGRWSPNLFEFYQRTVGRLTRDIAIPFRLQGLQRIDDTHVNEALREALVNCLIHADHEASGGVTVVRSRRIFRFENPGDLRVSVEQAFAGGVSDCRNPTLQRLFRMAGLGEQAGSGVPRILRAWEEQSWRWPDLWEDKERSRTTLFLPTASMLPEDSIERLRERLGPERFDRLGKDEIMALVTADVEGQVTKGRIAHLTQRHPSDAAAILRNLAEQGLLDVASRRVYTLARTEGESSQLSLLSSAHYRESSTHSDASTTPNAEIQGQPEVDPDWRRLQQLAEPVAQRKRQDRQVVREAIISMCRIRPLRPAELGSLLNRSAQALRQQYLNPLIDEGRLQYLYPGEPTHPNQAYRTTDGAEFA